MKQQAFNPYLPGWEYIPDGEPYILGDRVYIYGSHDSFGAPILFESYFEKCQKIKLFWPEL